MKTILLYLTLLVTGSAAMAQTISEVNLKTTETGKRKLKKAPKKIFIAEFKVFYQILYVAEETEKGRFNGSTLTGDVTAVLAMGLYGVSEQDLINNTNYLYNSTIQRMKAAGYEIVSANDMAGIKEFKGWERKQGGSLNNVQFKGFLMSTPSNFEYFVKGTTDDGREKKTFTDNSAKISFQGDNVTVVKINLIVPMAENGESYISSAFDLGGAKVVGKTALKISREAVYGKGITNGALTSCNFINSEAMSLPTSMMTYMLKDDIEIEGVVEKKKVKVEGVADIDFGTYWGNNYGVYRHFEVENRFMRKLVPIEVNPAVYNKGVREAGNAFLKKCWDDFFSNAQ